ncbi:MAG: hypothetical protein ABWZ40_11645 [Caulobacterales bacterium]
MTLDDAGGIAGVHGDREDSVSNGYAFFKGGMRRASSGSNPLISHTTSGIIDVDPAKRLN